MKSALVVVLGLAVQAHARNIDVLKVDYNQRTGAVSYQIDGGPWLQVKKPSGQAARVQKAGYYIDSPQCDGNACGPFYDQGYEFGGQPGHMYMQPQIQPEPFGYGGGQPMQPPMLMPPPEPEYYEQQGDHQFREYRNVSPDAPIYYGQPQPRRPYNGASQMPPSAGGGRPPGAIIPPGGSIGGMPPGQDGIAPGPGEMQPGAGAGGPPSEAYDGGTY